MKGAFTRIFDPMQDGSSLPILDFDQSANIELVRIIWLEA